MSGDRPGRRREMAVLASGPVLGAAVGVVTNIITSTWNWWLFSSLLVLITLAAVGAALVPGSDRTPVSTDDDPPPHRVRVNTLPPEAAVFSGRQEELRRLVESTPELSASRPFVCSITGPSGSGKTALAVQAAHRLVARYPDGQLFLRYRRHSEPAGRLSAQDVLASALTTIGAPAPQTRFGVDDMSGQWRSAVGNGRFLIVLDDITRAEQVRPILPNSRHAMVIVTSRRVVAGIDPDLHLEVGGLTRDEACSVITAVLTRASHDIDTSVISALAEIYRLPLTVRHVADRLITAPDGSGLCSGDGVPHRPGDDVNVDPFGWSVTALDPRDQLVFRRMALHPGPHVTGETAAVLAGIPVEEADRSLNELHRRGIIGRPDPHGYGVHDSVRALALRESELHDSSSSRTAAMRRLFRLTARQLALANAAIGSPLVIDLPADAATEPDVPTEEKAALEWLEIYLVDFRAVARLAVDEEWATTWQLTCGLSYFLRIHRNIVQAEELNESSLHLAVTTGDVLGQGCSHSQLGVLHRCTGRYRSALGHTQAALGHFETLGDDRGRAVCYAELAVIHYHLAEYAPARNAMERAVTLHGRMGGLRGVANGRGTLGLFSRATGDYAAARVSFDEALGIYQSLRNLRNEAWIRIELGTLDRLLGDYPSALDQFAAAHAICSDTGDRSGRAWAERETGITKRILGQYADAQALLEGALDVFTSMDSARNAADARVELGSLYRSMGDLAAARRHVTDARDEYERLGNRRGTAWANIELGVLDLREARWQAATERLEQAGRTYAAIGDRSGAARVELESGRLALARADPVTAREHLQRAVSAYRDLGAPEAATAQDLLSGL
ncbi:ATP-binding protein [Streptomyces sp. SID13666]|uniref:tetratricopeptide repeat protein n=1 Tax=unclassified Streptomyces TaxID=2593676 RepID=UPI0013C224AA|nr:MULTISPECIES: tetratricopeptide repeat protein [unclassified Streptomyces]NEA54594.1 ATP-binding protein [Streptomyces sp. SID13666]NEA70383.1 ATP-binding protein [Streptomyces sp. SID13588]